MTSPSPERRTYGMAPLIRFTLLTLYVALALPLAWIAPQEWRAWLWGSFVFGLAGMLALTSERVVVDADGLEVTYPSWCRWWLRRGWRLPWRDVVGLTPVATSQGGRVFYVRARSNTGPESTEKGRSFLLPQRVERFDDFLHQFSVHCGVSTTEVGRISPPWTYQLLAIMSLALLAGESLAVALRK